MKTIYNITDDTPIIFTAIHSGHKLSELCLGNFKLPEKLRMMEEDPFTDDLAKLYPNHIFPTFSRFEVDLNRSRDYAIYQVPSDCWGLDCRIAPPNFSQVEAAMNLYNSFYSDLREILNKFKDQEKDFLILDLHAYNHHRLGHEEPFDDPLKNPEIIIGTSNMSEKWFPLIEKLQTHMLEFDFMGRKLDIGINIKYPGGNFPRWIHKNFPKHGCAVSLEFKKFFMDEWSGELDQQVFAELKKFVEYCLTFIKDNFIV